MRSPITTHILDTSEGRPAAGVDVRLLRAAEAGWEALGQGRTNADGRVEALLPAGAIEPGRYRLDFEVGAWFEAHGRETFYPSVSITFDVKDGGQHYHVPLLLNPYGFTTYRGS